MAIVSVAFLLGSLGFLGVSAYQNIDETRAENHSNVLGYSTKKTDDSSTDIVNSESNFAQDVINNTFKTEPDELVEEVSEVISEKLAPNNTQPSKAPEQTETPIKDDNNNNGNDDNSSDYPKTCNYNSTSQQFLCLLNNYRVANNKPALSLGGTLNNVALGHSQWMNTNNKLSHTGENGSSFSQRCANAGTSCSAETVGIVPGPSAQNLLNAWKNSSAHNSILLGNYTYVGLGVSGDYATALFR